MKIQDVLKEKGYEVVDISEDQNLCEASQKMVENGIGALIVKNEQGGVTGIISERDLLRMCPENYQRMNEIRVRDVMTRDLLVGLLNDDLDYVENLMTQNKIRHLPVIEDQQLKGMISIGDIVKIRLKEVETENKYLQDYMLQG